MEKKIMFGALVLVAVAAVAMIAINAPTGNAVAKPAQCGGTCGNSECAAAQGGACNCEECPDSVCETGSCEGSCGNAECGAKVGGSCGCGK
jgi:hypothetical protein